MLDKLPVEILDMIFGQVSHDTSRLCLTCLPLKVKHHRDLKHLTEVCSRLHSCAIPRLYQSVVLSTTEISLGELATTVEAIPRKYSIYTQELGLSIPIHKRVVSLCVHLNGDDRDISEVPTEEDDIFYEWTDHEDTNDEHPGEESPEVSKGLMLSHVQPVLLSSNLHRAAMRTLFSDWWSLLIHCYYMTTSYEVSG